AAVCPIPISQQVPGLPPPGVGFDQLAPHPGGSRVRGDIDVQEFPAAVRDEQQDVQGAAGEGVDREQVRRPELQAGGGQEGTPGLAGRARRTASPILLDRALAYGDAELQQLTADPLAAPSRVLASDPGDQRPDLGTEPRATEAHTRLPAPEEAPALPVPA